jgi:hypothetical protein
MSGVTNQDTAVKFINDAEVMIDAYIGSPQRFYGDFSVTAANAVSSGTTLSGSFWGNRRPNYWAQGGHYVTVVDVPGEPTNADIGTSRLISASTSGQVTLLTGFTTDLPVGTEFRTHQESVFPRAVDTGPYSVPHLPPQLKQAVAWQVEFGILYGSEGFGLGDSSIAADEGASVQSRTYGSGYSETRIPGQERGLARWIAPKARAILRKLLSSTGRMTT